MINVLIADDHAVVREGIQHVLQSDPEIRVVGQVSDGLEAIEEAVRLHPDVVVMDIGMRRLSGLEATCELRRRCPRTRVVILSVYNSPEDVVNAISMGATGYVIKESAGSELIEAVRRAALGLSYFSEDVMPAVQERLRLAKMGRQPRPRLSPREREVLRLIAEGHSGREIATALGLSVETVKTHRRNLMAKLGLRNVAEVVRYALGMRSAPTGSLTKKSGEESAPAPADPKLPGPEGENSERSSSPS